MRLVGADSTAVWSSKIKEVLRRRMVPELIYGFGLVVGVLLLKTAESEENS